MAMKPCGDAAAWLGTHDSSQAAWDVCQRGDWMLWILGKCSGERGSDERKRLVLVACACARLALPYVKKGETRPLKSIEAAEDYARGGGTALDQVRAAAPASDASAASYAAADARKKKKEQVLSQCADIVRKHYPNPPI